MAPPRSLCVFCGSNAGAGSVYVEAACAMGAALAGRGLGLVYGGSTVGLMGALADAALAAGGRVHGVMPAPLLDKEPAHAGLTQLDVVGSMHERKARMAELADGFVALPGGAGTLEEFCEVWTWAQLGFHTKPCGLLNVNGYFDSWLGFVDHAVAEAFIRPEHRDMLIVSRQPGELIDAFDTYIPPSAEKWIGRAEL